MTEPIQRRPRWLRFSLRTLLVLMTVLCIWLGFKVNAARRQKEAVEAILKAGGTVFYDYQMIPFASPSVAFNFKVDPNAVPNGPAWLRKVVGEDYFRNASCVLFEDFHDDGALAEPVIAQIAELPKPRILFVGNFQRGIPGHVRVRNTEGSMIRSLVKSLVNATPVTTRIDDARMAYIGKMTTLEQLWLENNRVTDAGIKHLCNLTKLEELIIPSTDISSAGLGYIPKKRLKILDVQATDVDDLGMEQIGEMKSLESLQLDGTLVTDAGLQYLKHLNRLMTLGLIRTRVTPEGIRELQKSLPNCQISGP